MDEICLLSEVTDQIQSCVIVYFNKEYIGTNQAQHKTCPLSSKQAYRFYSHFSVSIHSSLKAEWKHPTFQKQSSNLSLGNVSMRKYGTLYTSGHSYSSYIHSGITAEKGN